ncbi:MAG: PAS domain S-box protein [Candidatus Omnitrophica bacterium]|nr:PAS domain S-box protein [Candidatus Omnitrophota bacterium]
MTDPIIKTTHRFKGSLQEKVIRTLCLYGGLSVVLTGAVIFAWVYGLRMETIKERQMEVAGILASTVDSMMEGAIKKSEVNVSSNFWKEVIDARNLEHSAMSREVLLRHMAELDKQWIAAKEDSPLVQECLRSPISVRLQNIVAVDKNIAEIFITDRDGGLVGTSGKTSDFYQADEAWWQKTYAGGKGSVYIGEAELDQSSGIMSIPIAVPVRDRAANVIGVCKESVNIDQFFAGLKAYSIGKSGHASLIDKDGTVIYHEGITPLSMKALGEKEMQKLNRNKIDFFLKKGNGTIHKRDIFVAIAPIRLASLLDNGITWYVVVAQDVREIFAPYYALALKFLLVLLAICGGAILLGIVFGDQIARPIRELHEATEKVMTGEWQSLPLVKTGDEIEQFSDTFREMLDHIRKNEKEILASKERLEKFSTNLERKVEERTRELSRSQAATLNILEDLTESKAFTENTLNTIDDIFYAFDPNGKLLRWNKTLSRVTGYNDQELATKVATDFFTSDDVPRVIKAMEKVFVEGRAKVEARLMLKDGRSIPYEVSGCILKDSHENVIGFSGTGRDLTDRKKAEEALRESEEWISTLLRSVGDGVIATDAKGNIVFMNKVAEDLTEWKPEEAAGKYLDEVFRIISEDTRQKMESPVVKVLQEGVVVGLANHTLLISRSGKEIPLSDSGAPIKNAKNEIIGVVLVFQDVTERRKAEKALKESQEFLSRVTNSVPEMVYVYRLGRDGKMAFDFVSRGAEEIFEYQADAIQKDFNLAWNLIFQEDAQGVQNSIFESARAMKRWDYEFRIRTPRGLVKSIHGTSIPQGCSEDGTITWIGTLIDITERRRADDEMLKLTRAIEQSPACIVITDLKGDIQYVNPRFTTMTGYAADEVRGKNPRILKSGETSPERYKELWDTIIAGREWRGEFHNKKKTGDLYWENASISPIWNTQGVMTGFMAVKEDITERKQWEEVLKDSEARHKVIFEMSADAIMLLDPRKGFVDGNPACIRLFECQDEAEFITKTPADLSPEYQPDGTPSAVKAPQMISMALEKGSHFFDWTHKTARGREFYATVLLTRIELKGEKLLQATVRDVTDYEKAKRALL